MTKESVDIWRTCQVCKERDRGLLKYAVRHYAHPECFVRLKGLAALGELHAWQLRTMPCIGLLRAKLANLDELLALIKVAERRERDVR